MRAERFRRAVSSGPYGRFARYYDAVYDGVLDYHADCDYLDSLFRRFLRRRPKSVLDLGCGTGSHAIELGRRGYEVVGLDLSKSQLAVARRKLRGKDLPVTFVQGHMARFDLRRRFDAAICMFGGFGYMLSERAVASHLTSVRRHLSPGGLYVFEFWHEPAAYDHHESYIYRQKPDELIRLDESRTDRRRRRLTMTFRFFALRGGRILERFTEVHVARLYTIPEMRRIVARGGLRLDAVYGGTGTRKTLLPPSKTTFRITAATHAPQ